VGGDRKDRREPEVARSVADGLSHRIGVGLFIFDSTVASDVRSILNKLGFNSSMKRRNGRNKRSL